MKQKKRITNSGDHRMDKPGQRRSLLLFGLAAVIIVIAASVFFVMSRRSDTHKFTWIEGGYRDEKDQITYRSAPLSYRAVKTEGDCFGTAEFSSFYRIVGSDRDFIAEIYRDDSTPYLCYREGVSLPSLIELSPTRMQICDNLGVTFYDVRDLSPIDSMTDLLSSPSEFDRVDGLETDSYRLIFRSELYPMLAYEVKIELTDRGSYIWDRGTGRIYSLPSYITDLLSGEDKN